MAYTDDSVKAKLSALNETQESIVTVAQWIMFHRRHADRTASLWLQKIKDAGVSKRLNLVYLANEVVQQSKARKRDDFLIAFSPIIAEATATAYRGAVSEVQQKLRRVVEVWRQRQIFELPIQESIESRIDELDKNRSSGKRSLLGNSNAASGPGVPPELAPLIPLQTTVTKAAAAITGGSNVSNTEYDNLMGVQAAPPSAPVYAARLSALLKSLANAEGAVTESIRARHDLIQSLEKLLESNRAAVNADEAEQSELGVKRRAVEIKRQEVEDEILRGIPQDAPPVAESLTSPAADGTATQPTPSLSDGDTHAMTNGDPDEPEPPQMEALTPPPVESLTPVQSPRVLPTDHSVADTGVAMDTGPAFDPFDPSSVGPPPTAEGYPADALADDQPYKRRKVDNDYPDAFVEEDNMAHMDADVSELLRAEGA